ncbi:MAG TPA: DUF4159 domain-containing protein [Bryobacteraceae bacterium]|nr:DUF4159 domain-containing protein [Bryobacteraceae bacterium]
MRFWLYFASGVFLFFGTMYAFQKPFKEFSGTEYYAGDIPLPPDWNDKTEFAFARMMFPGGPLDGYQRTGRFTGDYHRGLSLWTQDYPRADRHFLEAVRRLTRINTRSVEQVVDVEDGDDCFNWPFLYAVQAGEWGLTEKQGQRLREYLDRGGFFVGDDIHGQAEWGEWERRIKYAYPDRQMVDVPNDDTIFHTVYDLNDRQIIVGRDHLRKGSKNGGTVPRWVAVYDDKNRIVVAGWFNQDTGDSWEWADDPYYPEKYSAQGIRQGVNYIVYAMTH